MHLHSDTLDSLEPPCSAGEGATHFLVAKSRGHRFCSGGHWSFKIKLKGVGRGGLKKRRYLSDCDRLYIVTEGSWSGIHC